VRSLQVPSEAPATLRGAWPSWKGSGDQEAPKPEVNKYRKMQKVADVTLGHC
jgi:hypothetical protein